MKCYLFNQIVFVSVAFSVIATHASAQSLYREALPMWVNSSVDDYYPVWHPSGDTLFFVSGRQNDGILTRARIWYTTFDGYAFDSARLYPVNMLRRSPGALTVDQRGLMIVTATLGFDDRSHDQLWESVHYEDGKRTIERLDGKTSSDYWDTDPSLLRDGSALFFASAGFGVPLVDDIDNTDIFISRQEENGAWGKPVNLGPNVNTTAIERLPSISPFGNILYFTRLVDNRLIVHKSLRTGESDTSWSVAEPLVAPFNNGYDVAGFAPHPTGAFVILSAWGGEYGFDLFRIEIRKNNTPPVEHGNMKKG